MSGFEGRDVVLRPIDTKANSDRLPTLQEEMCAIYDRAWGALRDMMGEENAFTLCQSFHLHPDDPKLRENIGIVIEDNVIGLVDGWREGSTPEPKQMQLILAFFGIDRSHHYYDLSDYELVMQRDDTHSARMDAICEASRDDVATDTQALPPLDRQDIVTYIGWQNERERSEQKDDDDSEAEPAEDVVTRRIH